MSSPTSASSRQHVSTLTGCRPERLRHRRAQRACDHCRSRKVRCDVMVRKQSCTNCFLDRVLCHVQGKGPKLTGKRRAQNTSASKSTENMDHLRPHNLASQVHQHDNSGMHIEQQDKDNTAGTAICPLQQGSKLTLDSQHSFLSSYGDRVDCDDFDQFLDAELALNHTLAHSQPYTKETNQCSVLSSNRKSPQSESLSHQPGDSEPNNYSGAPSDLRRRSSFSCYAWLGLENLGNLPTDTIQLLESQGCLHLPHPEVLHELLKEYFHHSHPTLPLLSESDFWKLYHGNQSSNTEMSAISLFLLQAILTISCPSASYRLLEQMGFGSHCKARRAFYHRAKMLFDFGAETEVTSLVQGCLLLSFGHSNTMDGDKDGSYWLSIATRLAKSADMHILGVSPNDDSTPKGNIHKRIWQCCIVRDRTLSLGVRRPLQITLDQYDYQRPIMSIESFDTEVDQSSVHSREKNRVLMEIFVKHCELSIHLGSIITLVYPHSEGHSCFDLAECTRRVDQSRQALEKWRESLELYFYGNPAMDEVVSACLVTLYIYYNSALLALNNFLLLRIVHSKESAETDQIVSQVRKDIRINTINLTQKITAISKVEFSGFLTLGMAAYIAFPLMVYTANTQISFAGSDLIARKKLLDVVQKILEIMKTRFDNLDLITRATENFIRLLNHEIVPTSYANGQACALRQSNGDIMSWDLRTYITLPLYVDFILSKGRLPPDDSMILNKISPPTTPQEPRDAEMSPFQHSLHNTRHASPSEFPFSTTIHALSNPPLEAFTDPHLEDYSQLNSDIIGELLSFENLIEAG